MQRAQGAHAAEATERQDHHSVPREIGGEWEPEDAEQRAAWEFYVELVTRVSVAPLRKDDGSAREALTSMYVLFEMVRDILKRYGPDVAPPGARNEVSFGILAVTVLNRAVRPVLSRWHPRLAAWESSAPAGRSGRRAREHLAGDRRSPSRSRLVASGSPGTGPGAG